MHIIKNYWSTVKRLINSSKENQSLISENQWTDYFYSLLNKKNNGNNPFNEYVQNSLKLLENLDENSKNPLDINKEISKAEIIKVIKNIKNNKATGPDLISNEMIKCSIKSLIDPLFLLFNSILKDGNFPESWNCSLITPLHKSGSINDPTNYRGIAVSNTLSKVFIKILTNRLDTHMSENKLWSKFQGGFKKNIRTEDNIFILNTLITECIKNKNESLYVCFVDFSKFFDTINRNFLFYKLLKYGITGNIYRTIKSMYNSCEYAVKTCNGITNSFESGVGVKQGCGMSPILSNIYQNDLYKIFDHSCSPISLNNELKINCLSWADD